MSIAIKADNVSKKYILNHTSSYETIGEKLSGLFKGAAEKNEPNEEFWALKDLSFEIKQGDRVGIIGRNGAGKSTLLKILSRIVEPSSGKIEINGKISSLLEVGTGFHGELSGRENIFLNGSILGMSKAEIRQRFDEIVDFAEIEKFIDTPVKRYSSGMYVRLAFAVAAHLEPDILILDEVLAVGDAAFQKKCIGKVQNVAGQGKTILFVSHNIHSVLTVCNKGLFLENGRLSDYGDVIDITAKYMGNAREASTGLFVRNTINESVDLILSAELLNDKGERAVVFSHGDNITLKIKTNSRLKEKFGVSVKIKNSKQENIGIGSSWINHQKEIYYKPGDDITVSIPRNSFTEDKYFLDIICNDWGKYHVDNFWDTVSFQITNCKPGDFPVFITPQRDLGNVLFRDITFN